MFPAQEEADRTVFVGNLEARVREEILYELFLQVPSAGKAGRRLWSPGTPPHRSSGLPSFPWAHKCAAGDEGSLPLQPRVGNDLPPQPPSLPAPGEGCWSLCGPWMCCGTQNNPSLSSGDSKHPVSSLNMVPVPGHYPFCPSLLMGKAVYSRILQVITDWVPWP